MNLPAAAYQAVTDPRLSHLNVGSGVDCSIAELVNTVAQVTGYQGRIEWDPDKPDGAPRKLMDSSKLQSLGWSPEYDLRRGLEDAYAWFVEHAGKART